MPAYGAEGETRLWSRSSVPRDINTNHRESTSRSPSNPSTPYSSSPENRTSPFQRRRASTPDVSPRECEQNPMPSMSPPRRSLLVKLLGWYPVFLLRLIHQLIATGIYLAWSQLLLIGPTLWISVWLWLFWKIIQLPLIFVKWFITCLHTSQAERSRRKRTVLISCGSTIQALHLARNFYSAGARVVVCEIEGLFGLARFSTAVHKFYNIPRPAAERPQIYVQALCEIVEKEKVAYYIPVCATNTAYYDALAKPHLEQMGCSCFCPDVKQVWILDDVQAMISRCQDSGLPIPPYYSVTSRNDVLNVYDSGLIRTGRHFMASVGSVGCRDRIKLNLPLLKQHFRMPYEMSSERPWVIVQDLPGEHYLTCTTVKESQVVANVICKINQDHGGLVAVENEEISQWLKVFFSKIRALRQFSGHVSFRFVKCEANGVLLPLGSRIGVSLPYICHTSVHPRMVWKPCKHFNRQSSGPLVAEQGRYWMHEAVLDTLRHPSVESVTRLIGTVLDKREALFVFWDPLPYCAYYHMQLPFRNVLQFIRGRNAFQGLVMARAQ